MKRSRVQSVLFAVALVLVASFVLYPIVLMFKISLSEPGDIFQPFHRKNLLYPESGLTLRHWRTVFSSGLLGPSLLKSLGVATAVTLLAILIAAPAAYVISRLKDKKYRYIFIISLFVSRLFPEVAIALPVSVTFLSWKLIDTSLGLVLAHLIRVLPYVGWILVGTFETIPRSLEEASFVDGAGKLETLYRVVIPLALPGVSAAAMLAWLESWNEFTYALYLTISKNTLPLQTYYFINRGSIFTSAAYATIITIPVIIITYLLQKYIRSDMLAGALRD